MIKALFLNSTYLSAVFNAADCGCLGIGAPKLCVFVRVLLDLFLLLALYVCLYPFGNTVGLKDQLWRIVVLINLVVFYIG